MLSQYYSLGLDTLNAKATQLNSNKQIKEYYSGIDKHDTEAYNQRYEETKSLINMIAISDKVLNSVYIFAENGKGISAYGLLAGDTYEEFIKSKEGKNLPDLTVKAHWTGQHSFLDKRVNIKEDDYGIALYKNFYSVDNDIIGYIVLDVNIGFIKDSLSKINFDNQCITGFITNDGREILEGNDEEDFIFGDQEFYKEALNSEQENGSSYVFYNGQTYLYLYSKVATGNAIICSLIPRSMIISQAQDVKIATILIVIIASMIAIIIGSIISYAISGDIHKTNLTLDEVSRGDLTVQVNLNRKDEFSTLGNGINYMIEGMQSLVIKMIQVSSTVSSSALDVSQNSELFLNTSKQISDAVSDIDQGLSEQAADTEKCLTQMEVLSNQIDTLTNNTNEMNQITDTTKNVIGDGMIIVAELNEKSKDTADITQSIINDIEYLEVESLLINSIVDSINDIARQTNLLSLNASIEAARAGEQGKGFAVVAQEIRNLAQESEVSANQIGDIISNIQLQTEKTVRTTRQADDIVASQEEALEKATEIFYNINSRVEQLVDSLAKITTSITSMEITKNDTLYAISNISAASEETVAASGQLGITANNQLDAIAILSKAAEGLEEDVKNLEEIVSVFKIE